MIGCIRKRNHLRFPEKTICVRDFSKYNPLYVNNELRQKDWSCVYNASDVNEAVNNLNTILNETFNKHAPFINKRIKGRPCPWLDKDTKAELNNRDKALRKVRRTKDKNDWKIYKTLRNHCNNLLRYAKSKFNKNLLVENRNNPEGFWKVIKKIFPKKASTNATSSGHSKKARVERFSEHYANVIHSIKSKFIHCRDFIWQVPAYILPRTLKSFQFTPVSEQSILKQLKSLKHVHFLEEHFTTTVISLSLSL